MNICIKSCLIASLGLFFLYLIIQQVFSLSVEGFNVDDIFDPFHDTEEHHKKKDEDRFDPFHDTEEHHKKRGEDLFDPFHEIEEHHKKRDEDRFDPFHDTEEHHKKKDEDPNTISDKERVLQRKNDKLKASNKSLLSHDAVDDFMLAAEKNRISKTEAHNIILRHKLKKTESVNHHMHSHLRKLDNEINTKDDELSKIESDLFKCLQKQIHPTPTHQPKPK